MVARVRTKVIRISKNRDEDAPSGDTRQGRASDECEAIFQLQRK